MRAEEAGGMAEAAAEGWAVVESKAVWEDGMVGGGGGGAGGM